jgi:hypothetical protein
MCQKYFLCASFYYCYFFFYFYLNIHWKGKILNSMLKIPTVYFLKNYVRGFWKIVGMGSKCQITFSGQNQYFLTKK